MLANDPAQETLAMNLGFVILIVGPAVSGAPGLSAFCRGLEDLGYDTPGWAIAWSRRLMWTAAIWPTGRR